MTEQLVKIDAAAAEKKLSLMRRYIFEIITIVLAVVSGYLYNGQKSLEKDMRTYLNNDKQVLIEKVEKSSLIINENTSVLKQTNEVIKDFKEVIFKTKIK